MQTPIRIGDCVRKDQKDKRVVSFNKGITGLIAFDDNTGVIGVGCLTKFECLETPNSSYALLVNDNSDDSELINEYNDQLTNFRKFSQVNIVSSSNTDSLTTLSNELKKPKSLVYLVINNNKDASAQSFLTKEKLKQLTTEMDSSSRFFILLNCKNADGFVTESDIDISKKCAVIVPNRKDLPLNSEFGLFGTRFIQWQTKYFAESKCSTTTNMIQLALGTIGIGEEKSNPEVSPAVIVGNSAIMDCVYL